MRSPDDLEALQARIGVTFRSIPYLEQALRHRSVVLEQPLESNERLEFLGDAVLGLVASEELYARFPESAEGELAKAKAFLVSEPTLAQVALDIGLDAVVELSPSEETAGGRGRRSILSDTFEAIVAAIYLDQGIRAARRFIRACLKDSFKQVSREEHYRDYKSLLQERLQARVHRTPRYKIVSESGAEHDKTFVALVLSGTKPLGQGTGKSKKQAEQEAARLALETLDNEPLPKPRRRAAAP